MKRVGMKRTGKGTGPSGVTKMQKSKQAREKKDLLINAGVVAYIVGLIVRIPLMGIIGKNGIGYFASVNEIIHLTILFIAAGLAETVRVMIKYKIKREQYKGAQRIFKCALLVILVFGAAACILLLLLQGFVADIVLLEPMSRLSLGIAAPVLFFSSLTGLLRGYFQGTGTQIPTMHSLLLEKMMALGLGLLFAGLFYRYGLKVAAILHEDDFAGAYGAMGAFVGILIASVLSFLHLLLIYMLYRGTVKRQLFKEGFRMLESRGQVYGSFFWSALPYGLAGILYHMSTLFDQRIYYYHRNLSLADTEAMLTDHAVIWGEYYGIALVVLSVFMAVGCLLPGHGAKKITVSWNRDEQRSAREHLTGTVNLCLFVTVPVAAFIAVLAGPLAGALMSGMGETAAEMIQWGSPLIVLGPLCYLWITLLKQHHKLIPLLLTGGGAYLLHLAAIYLLLSRTSMDINGVVLSNVVMAAGIAAAGFILISRLFKCYREWMQDCIRTLAVALICGGVTGLLIMLLNMAVRALVGEVVSVILCLAVGIPAYLLLMILFKGIREEDMERLPGGIFLREMTKRIFKT